MPNSTPPMDSSQRCIAFRPCSLHHPLFICNQHPHSHHHHHHHHHLSPNCPLHGFLLHPNSTHSNNNNTYPFFIPPPSLPPNPHPVPCVPSQTTNYGTQADDLMMQEENEELEVEDDDDPVFVLTDEWREFFAKSEAKKRLAKQEAKKKGKKNS